MSFQSKIITMGSLTAATVGDFPFIISFFFGVTVLLQFKIGKKVPQTLDFS